MARIILVHGALHGAWCWERVAPRLEALGHDVLALDLPGLGDDPTPPDRVTADDWADCVADAARHGSGKAILVGHSLGGTAIAQGGERATEHVAGLIFVSAVLVRDGETMDSVCPEIMRAAQEAAERHADDPAAAATAIFYRHCAPEVAAEAVARLKPQPQAVADTPLRLTREHFGSLRRAYIECDDDTIMPLVLQRRMQAALPCDPVVTMASDHSPFLCQPDVLAGHIDSIARMFSA